MVGHTGPPSFTPLPLLPALLFPFAPLSPIRLIYISLSASHSQRAFLPPPNPPTLLPSNSLPSHLPLSHPLDPYHLPYCGPCISSASCLSSCPNAFAYTSHSPSYSLP